MLRLVLATAVVALVGSAGCAPPKVLIKHQFVDADKSAKTYIERGTDNLFRVSARVCDVQGNNQETNCKDTLLLENVVPGSVY